MKLQQTGPAKHDQTTEAIRSQDLFYTTREDTGNEEIEPAVSETTLRCSILLRFALGKKTYLYGWEH